MSATKLLALVEELGRGHEDLVSYTMDFTGEGLPRGTVKCFVHGCEWTATGYVSPPTELAGWMRLHMMVVHQAVGSK